MLCGVEHSYGPVTGRSRPRVGSPRTFSRRHVVSYHDIVCTLHVVDLAAIDRKVTKSWYSSYVRVIQLCS